MNRQDEWTRESEAAALAQLRRAAESSGPKHRSPRVHTAVEERLQQGRHAARPFTSPAARLGHEPARAGRAADRALRRRRPLRQGDVAAADYLRMMERIRSAEPGEIGAVAFYD